jgi:hypothetical protein
VFLLAVVHRHEGLLGEGDQPRPQVGLGLQHLALRHAGLEEGLHDLGLVPVRLGLDDPAQVVTTRPEPPLDHAGPEPGRELELDHRHDRQLVLADLVLRPWFREA